MQNLEFEIYELQTLVVSLHAHKTAQVEIFLNEVHVQEVKAGG